MYGKEKIPGSKQFRSQQQVQNDYREERLYFAIQGGQCERLETLLSSGCNPDHKLEGIFDSPLLPLIFEYYDLTLLRGQSIKQVLDSFLLRNWPRRMRSRSVATRC